MSGGESEFFSKHALEVSVRLERQHRLQHIKARILVWPFKWVSELGENHEMQGIGRRLSFWLVLHVAMQSCNTISYSTNRSDTT